MKPRIMTNTADKLHNLVRLCMLPRLGCHTLVCKRLMCPAPVRVSCCYGRLVQYLTYPLALQLFEGRPGVLGSTGGFVDAVVATCFVASHMADVCVCVGFGMCGDRTDNVKRSTDDCGCCRWPWTHRFGDECRYPTNNTNRQTAPSNHTHTIMSTTQSSFATNPA